MTIKDIYTTKKVEQIVQEVETILSKYGASKIMKELGDDGKPYSLSFMVRFGDREMPFRLPVKVSEVHRWMELEKRAGNYKGKTDYERAYRIAWTVLRNWVRSQLEMITINQVDLAEVMMPYLQVSPTQSLYDKYKDNISNLTN